MTDPAKKELKHSLEWGEDWSGRLWKGLYSRFDVSLDDKVILDFGCAWGYFCRYMLTNFKPRKVIGVDIRDHWNRTNNSWDWRAEEKLELIAGNMVDITNIPTQSVDLIFCTSVLQYLNPELLQATLDKLFSLLRPGGEFICRTRTFASHVGADLHSHIALPYAHMLYSRREIDEVLDARDRKAPYLNYLTGSTYIEMFSRAGFAFKDVRRRKSAKAPEVLDRMRAAYPFISENELICSEVELHVVRPAETQ
jgi:SAM-dependent methyltransferase